MDNVEPRNTTVVVAQRTIEYVFDARVRRSFIRLRTWRCIVYVWRLDGRPQRWDGSRIPRRQTSVTGDALVLSILVLYDITCLV